MDAIGSHHVYPLCLYNSKQRGFFFGFVLLAGPVILSYYSFDSSMAQNRLEWVPVRTGKTGFIRQHFETNRNLDVTRTLWEKSQFFVLVVYFRFGDLGFDQVTWFGRLCHGCWTGYWTVQTVLDWMIRNRCTPPQDLLCDSLRFNNANLLLRLPVGGMVNGTHIHNGKISFISRSLTKISRLLSGLFSNLLRWKFIISFKHDIASRSASVWKMVLVMYKLPFIPGLKKP